MLKELSDSSEYKIINSDKLITPLQQFDIMKTDLFALFKMRGILPGSK